MKNEKAREYIRNLPREVLPKRVGMPEAIEAVELAEQEAEERMRENAIEAFCASNCPKGCSFVADGNIGCGAMGRFLQKLM